MTRQTTRISRVTRIAAGRVGSGQGDFKISRVGSGRVETSRKSRGSGRVGSRRLGNLAGDPTRPARFDPTREKPCNIQVRTTRHGLYSRASNILRSRYVRVRPHTICFLSTAYFMAWSGGVPYIFDTKNKGKIIVSPVVKLRLVKVVVKVDSIHGRNQWVACIRPVSHRTRLMFFPPEKILWTMACFVVAVVPDSVNVIVCRPSASGRVGTQLTKKVCVASYLTCSLLLIAD